MNLPLGLHLALNGSLFAAATIGAILLLDYYLGRAAPGRSVYYQETIDDILIQLDQQPL